MAITSKWDSWRSIAAISDWKQSPTGGYSTVVATSPESLRSARRSKESAPRSLGKILVCNAAYGKRGWLGIAHDLASSGNHITKATTKLNDSYHNSSPYNHAGLALVWSLARKSRTISGLATRMNNSRRPIFGTCMDYTNRREIGGGAYGPSNEHPNDHDFAAAA